MPRPGAASTISRTRSAPRSWPKLRGLPRASAQRPFPSITTATCAGPDLRRVLFIAKRRAGARRARQASERLARAGCPDQSLHVIEIAFERAAAGGAQAIVGAGRAAFERLLADDVAGLLELARVQAEIAVGGAQQILELAKRKRLVGGQGAHHAEPDALVDEAIELRRR